MKLITGFIIATTLIGITSSCQYSYVTSIVHSYNTNKTTYFANKDTIAAEKAVVNQGSKVSLIIKDFNPLSINITVNQEVGSLNYQSNNFSPLMNMLSVGKPTAASASSITDKSNDSLGLEKKSLNDSSLLILPSSNTELNKILSKISDRNKIIRDTLEYFNNFYNAIAQLHNLIGQAKYNNKLNSDCLCQDLKFATENIIRPFFPQSHNPNLLCSNTLVCNDLISGDEFTYQKIKYYDDLKYNLILIDSLESNLNKYIDSKGLTTPKKNDDIYAINKSTKLKPNDKILKIKEINDLYDNLSSNKEDLNELRKLLNVAKDNYNSSQSKNIDLTVSEYKAISYLEFTKNEENLKAEDTDDLPITINFENSITNKTTTRKIVLDVVKPLKIDYSAGVYLAPSLYDESYELIQNQGGLYSLKKINGGKISYGAVGYINFHPVFCNQWLSFGLSLGTGLMFNTATKIIFTPTASIFLGKYQRAVIHFGCGFSQVDRVHSQYADNFTFTDASYKPEIKKETSSSFLIALTWNLSRK